MIRSTKVYLAEINGAVRAGDRNGIVLIVRGRLQDE